MNNIENYNTMNINHAGGVIDGNHYTNSYESIIQSIQISPNSMIEIDIIKIKNGFVIAHNDMEHLYGFNGKFSNITLDEFNSLQVCGKYTPMDCHLLKKITELHPNTIFNLDIKEQGETYEEFLKYISGLFGKTNQLIPHVYEIEDINRCIKYGFGTFIVGMWKFYSDIYSQPSQQFIKDVQNIPNIKILGFSIDFKHYTNENFNAVQKEIKSNIFFHGQNNNTCIEKYNSINLYFYI